MGGPTALKVLEAWVEDVLHFIPSCGEASALVPPTENIACSPSSFLWAK